MKPAQERGPGPTPRGDRPRPVMEPQLRLRRCSPSRPRREQRFRCNGAVTTGCDVGTGHASSVPRYPTGWTDLRTAVRASRFGTADRACVSTIHRARRWHRICGMCRYMGKRRRRGRPSVCAPPSPLVEPPRTQLEWEWAICITGWAVWFRGLVLRVLAVSQSPHAALKHHKGCLPRKLLVVTLAIASVIGHRAIVTVLSRIP